MSLHNSNSYLKNNNNLKNPFVFSYFLCVWLCVKDFNLHSFINLDNFTNGEIDSDKKKIRPHFQKVIRWWAHVHGICIRNKCNFLTQLLKIRVFLYIVLKKYDAHTGNILFQMNASEINIHRHGKAEETLNWTVNHGREIILYSGHINCGGLVSQK